MPSRHALIAAVKSRDTAKVKEYLDRDPGLAATVTDEGSLLLTAVFYGAREVAELIRERRAGELNLDEAIAVNDTGRVQELLESSPHLAVRHGDDGSTPLHLAAFMDRLEAVHLLLEKGANVNAFTLRAQPNIPRNTALHAALAGRRWQVARLLIERGADVAAVDSAGLTPLHHAALGGSGELVALLLEKGAPVGLRDNRGETALGQAVRRGNNEAAELLKRAGDSV